MRKKILAATLSLALSLSTIAAYAACINSYFPWGYYTTTSDPKVFRFYSFDGDNWSRHRLRIVRLAGRASETYILNPVIDYRYYRGSLVRFSWGMYTVYAEGVNSCGNPTGTLAKIGSFSVVN